MAGAGLAGASLWPPQAVAAITRAKMMPSRRNIGHEDGPYR
jgi:hypothetical protein